MTTVGAIVVDYNAGDHLRACVRSLRAAEVMQLIVVDNASTDTSVADLRRDDPEAEVFDTGANLGYGAGVNRGAAALAKTDRSVDVLLVCNADLLVEPTAVKALVNALDADPTLGIVAPRIDNADGTLYPSARTFPHAFDAVGHAFFGLIAPGNRFTRRYRLLDWDHAQPRRVDWVSGACFAIRRDLFDRVGGFDEGYFMYLEDVDLCRRAGATGAGIGYEPAARVTHVQGVSTDQLPYKMLFAHHRSIMRWWWSTTRWPGRVLAPFVVAGLAVRFSLAALARLVRGRR